MESTSVKTYLENINVAVLPEQAAQYFQSEILTDPQIALLEETNPAFKEMLDALEKQYPNAIKKEEPVAPPPAPVPEKPKPTKADYEKAIKTLEQLAKYKKGEEQKKYLSAVKTLKLLMKHAPEKYAIGGWVKSIYESIRKNKEERERKQLEWLDKYNNASTEDKVGAKIWDSYEAGNEDKKFDIRGGILHNNEDMLKTEGIFLTNEFITPTGEKSNLYTKYIYYSNYFELPDNIKSLVKSYKNKDSDLTNAMLAGALYSHLFENGGLLKSNLKDLFIQKRKDGLTESKAVFECADELDMSTDEVIAKLRLYGEIGEYLDSVKTPPIIPNTNARRVDDGEMLKNAFIYAMLYKDGGPISYSEREEIRNGILDRLRKLPINELTVEWNAHSSDKKTEKDISALPGGYILTLTDKLFKKKLKEMNQPVYEGGGGVATPSAVQTLIDELTDIGIDLEGEDEEKIAGFRGELEDYLMNQHQSEANRIVFELEQSLNNISDKDRKAEIESSIKKYRDSVINSMKKTSGIPNNYIGKMPEQVWNEWLPEQRIHFLKDHNIYEGYLTPDEILLPYKDVESHPGLSKFKSELEKHISEGQYAKGGPIKNQYAGKTAKQVWDSWTSEQRQHFIGDHEVLSPFKKQNNDVSNLTWDKLPANVEGIYIKGVISQHVSQGQYGLGGWLKSKFGKKTIVGWKVSYTTPDGTEETKEFKEQPQEKAHEAAKAYMKGTPHKGTILLSPIYQYHKNKKKLSGQNLPQKYILHITRANGDKDTMEFYNHKVAERAKKDMESLGHTAVLDPPAPILSEGGGVPRIESEVEGAIKLMAEKFPGAVDYHVEDEKVSVLDKDGKEIGTITTDELTDYWNTVEGGGEGEGIAVQFFMNGKFKVVSADITEQAELIKDALEDYKAGDITRQQLEDTLQSYMGDEYAADEKDIVEKNGIKGIEDDFYGHWIPFYNQEPIHLDKKGKKKSKGGAAGVLSAKEYEDKLNKMSDYELTKEYEKQIGTEVFILGDDEDTLKEFLWSEITGLSNKSANLEHMSGDDKAAIEQITADPKSVTDYDLESLFKILSDLRVGDKLTEADTTDRDDAIEELVKHYKKVMRSRGEKRFKKGGKIHPDIDFSMDSQEDERISFGPETNEYKELDKLQDTDAWQKYLDEMASRGITVEYNSVDDTFDVITGTPDSYEKGGPVHPLKVTKEKEFWHARFSNPKGFTTCRVPAWGERVASYVHKGSKITTCKNKKGKWSVQKVMIPTTVKTKAQAIKIAQRIFDKIAKKK
jgi:hypothetical protein